MSNVPAIVVADRLVTETRAQWRDALGARADEALAGAHAAGRSEIALDLRDTVAVDASGLGLLVLVRQRARERGLAVRLLNVAPPIRELLALTRLAELFVFDD